MAGAGVAGTGVTCANVIGMAGVTGAYEAGAGVAGVM